MFVVSSSCVKGSASIMGSLFSVFSSEDSDGTWESSEIIPEVVSEFFFFFKVGLASGKSFKKGFISLASKL